MPGEPNRTLSSEIRLLSMKILLTGANGYIGMRLLPALLTEGHEVWCCVRNSGRFPVDADSNKGLHVVEADFLREETLKNLPKQIDAAYYLIHSMSDGSGEFRKKEQESAENFIKYIDKTDAQQVIYLSGISNGDELSEHLKSRFDVEAILGKSHASLTVFRAGIIVGSGSASFEIIRDLVEKLPVMIAPKWLQSKCQPLAIRDVIGYLKGALGNRDVFDEVYDIGGPDVLTYKEMLLQFAEVRGLKRYIITVPFLTPRLSSLWMYFVTSTSYNLVRNLVDSMTIDVVASDNRIQAIIPIQPIGYREAVSLAFQKISQNIVPSSWKDAMSSSGANILDIEKFVDVPHHGCFKDHKERVLNQEAEKVLDKIWQIGGSTGWYYGTYLWKIRGYMDKLFGGTGLRRGRRSPTDIHPGDALDFWRVLVSSREQARLLLYAEMKLPGEAWLEFKITEKKGHHILTQTATFRPRGIWGRMYWYAVWPFHIFVFRGMINKIARP